MSLVRGERVNCDVLILAGGKSRRMGTDKAGLELAGKTLLEHAVDNARTWGCKRILVAGPPRPWLEADYVSDPPGFESSSLLGFLAGLQACSSPWTVVVGCDMPFVKGEVVELLWSARNQGGAAASWDNRLQPLPGLYPARTAQVISVMLSENRFHLANLLDRLQPAAVPQDQVAEIDPHGVSFFNINSPEDLTRAQSIARP